MSIGVDRSEDFFENLATNDTICWFIKQSGKNQNNLFVYVG